MDSNAGHHAPRTGTLANKRIGARETSDWAGPVWQEEGDVLPNDEHCLDPSQGQAQNQLGTPIRPCYERQCARSLLLCNLSESTTYLDITEAIRGGQLLDIFIRTHERNATVSFVHALDASSFYDHVRRHDLYIKHKRVSIVDPQSELSCIDGTRS